MVAFGLGKAAASLLLAADLGERFRRATPTWTVGSDAEETANAIRELHGDAGYWPTPWLGGFLGGHLQTIWYGLNPIVPSFPFTEERWQTTDGGTLGLAYPEVPSTLPLDAPVVLILPGLCGSIKGTGHTVQAILDAGCRPVCLHARGCGVELTSPCFNIFGDTDDLRTALARIAGRFPEAPRCLYSISAGTALMVRFLGEEGESAVGQIAAAVANCPGYDIGVCMQRVGYLYDSGFYIGVLKKHWLSGTNGEVLRAAAPELHKRMADAPDMHAFMVAASPFASSSPAAAGVDPGTIANGFSAFLGRTNPMGVAHKIAVPSLILNSDDDPVCAALNTEENGPALVGPSDSCPRTVLLRYRRGGHCCFARGWRARRFADELGAGVLASLAAKTRTGGSS